MKRFSIWLGLIAASWALVLGLVMCARAALAQAPVVPESVTNAAVKGFDEGGYKAVAIVALVGCVACAAMVLWLIKAMLGHLKVASDIALEQAKADVITGRELTEMKNGLRAKGIIP